MQDVKGNDDNNNDFPQTLWRLSQITPIRTCVRELKKKKNTVSLV